jgi:hypothetical protein
LLTQTRLEETDLQTRYPRTRAAAILFGLLLAVRSAVAAPSPAASGTADVAAARAVFQRNLQAIRDRDRDAYLSCYLDSERLVRTGPDGPDLGYAGLAATAGQGWPDHIEADDMRLTPIRPGVV